VTQLAATIMFEFRDQKEQFQLSVITAVVNLTLGFPG